MLHTFVSLFELKILFVFLSNLEYFFKLFNSKTEKRERESNEDDFECRDRSKSPENET